MQLRNLSPGTRIQCNVRGRIFEATVAAPPAHGSVEIEPPKGINYHHVTARQVVRRLDSPWNPDRTQIKRSK